MPSFKVTARQVNSKVALTNFYRINTPSFKKFHTEAVEGKVRNAGPSCPPESTLTRIICTNFYILVLTKTLLPLHRMHLYSSFWGVRPQIPNWEGALPLLPQPPDPFPPQTKAGFCLRGSVHL